jgi:hypothetical protein
MSETDPIRAGKTRSRLPLNEDDLQAGAVGPDVNTVSLIEGLSYQKLFLTIILAAPVAAVLAMMATDVYSALARKIGLRAETQFIAPPPPRDAVKDDDRLKSALDGLAKANRDISAVMEKQTAALSRIASREQAPQHKDVAVAKSQKAETEPVKETAKPEPKTEKPAHRAEKDKLSVSEARDRVEELSGVDIGEPVKSFKQFESMKSRETLRETGDALDVIIAGAKSGGTLKKNAEKAKKIVNGRLASLDKK